MLETRYFSADMFAAQPDLFSKSKQLLAAVLAPVQTWRWRRFIRSCSPLADTAVNSPALSARIYRPYLVAHLGLAQRVDMLMMHYRLALDAGLGNLIKRASAQSLPLCDFSGKSGTRYQLTISAIDHRRNDGEFVIRLKAGHALIYTAAFSLIEHEGRRQLKLGGLHGLLAVDDALRIKKITRDFFGWRPRDLMISVLRELASCLDCTRLVLVSNAHRLPSGEKRVCVKSSNYDRLWQEMNAAMRSDGDFELPCTALFRAGTGYPENHLPSMADLPRREAFSYAILNQIGQWIATEKNMPHVMLP